MIDVTAITRLHRDMVADWHVNELHNRFQGLLAIVCQQFQFNFQLWHEEDVARSPDVGDARIAQVKRAIDRFNQQRNDWIERIDDWITEDLRQRGTQPAEDALLNTETPGSVVDRLSIMTLRIYHMEEQLQRTDATPEHRESVQRKLATCRIQHEDLSNSLRQLLSDIYQGRKRHKTYRQHKMYNDPTLNPYLYGGAKRQAG
jgi:hypothetical protein